MARPRPAEVLTALKRLGFVDKPGVGDHFNLWKNLVDHPDGPVTIKTGIDMGQRQCSDRDISRIRRQAKLSGKLWAGALDRTFTKERYNEHLRGIPKEDLVPSWWRQKILDAKRTAQVRTQRGRASKGR